MRILYFTRDYTPHDHRFLSALAKTGHEIFSLRLEARGLAREARPLPAGVQQVGWLGGQKPVRWWDYPALSEDFKRVVETIQPDLVHAGPIQSAAFLAAWSGFQPLVSMSWGSDLLVEADSSFRMKRLTRYTLRRTRLLLADCQAVVNKAAGFGFPPERTVVFPWGVDLDQFTPGKGDLREELGWQDQFVLLSVRSWEPLYGVDVLARAFTQAAQRLPHLRLMLLSGGSQEALIRRIFREGGVESQVYFGGHIPNDRLRDFYRSTDLYLSASHSDGSSVSLMEALACGCPAMVSDIPGNREWITPGEQGWLFPDGDADALAAQIGQAVESRDSLPEMKVAARRLAERRADWNKNFQILLSAYQTAVEAEIND